MKVYVEGQLQTRKWTDQNGQEKYSTEVVLQRFRGELQMLDGKGEGGGSFQGSSGGGYDNSFGSQGGQGGGSRPMEGPKEDFSNADLDDEIPF
jgi:single-strand DNA-binding protein